MIKSNSLLFQKSLLAIAVATGLSACGGGSGGNNDNGGTTGSVDATLSGVASKGIIINGTVTADELNADKSVKHANVGSATTDADGKYDLTLNNSYTGGPVKVTVTAGGSTTMVCDAVSGCGTRTDGLTDDNGTIDFGEQYKPASLEMSALLPELNDGATVSAQITPFTDMAAQRALTQSTLDNAAINNANSEVSNLLGGIDILTTPPVDITDPASLGEASASEQVYAALAASIAELAPRNSDGQPDIEQALTTLSTDFADGNMTAADTVGSDTVIALDEIVTQASSALDEVGAMDSSGVLADMQGEVSNATDGNVDPQPSPNAGDSNVAKAKAFLADLRTWGVTIGGQIDAPSQAFETQIDMAGQAADMMQNDPVGGAIELGVMALTEYFQASLSTLTDFTDSTGAHPFSAGNFTKTPTEEGVEYSISAATVMVNGENVALSMTLLLPADTQGGNVISFGIKSISSEDSSSKLTVSSGTAKVTLASTYTIDYNALNAGTAPQPSAPEKLELNVALSATQKKTLDASGALVAAVDPITFSGSLNTIVFPYTDSNGEVIDAVPGSFQADGNISNTSGDSYDMTITASIPDAANVMPVNDVLNVGSNYATNNSGDHLISWTNDGNQFVYHSPYVDYTASFTPGVTGGMAEVSYTQNLHYSDGYSNTFSDSYSTALTSLDAFVANNFNNYDYSNNFWIDGQGNYAPTSYTAPDFTTPGYLEYVISEPAVVFFDASQPLIGSLGVQFMAQFKDLPQASISVTGNATGFEKGNATVTINFDNRSLSFAANNESASGAEGSMTITNQNGVALTVNATEATEKADITINGTKVADLTSVAGDSVRVDFIDGTFEIF